MRKNTLDITIGTLWQPREDKIKQINNQDIKYYGLKQTINSGAVRVENDLKQAKPVPLETKLENKPLPITDNPPLPQAPIAPTISPPVTLQNIENWHSLVSTVQNCEQCKLCQGRTHVVIERGSRDARWMFIGEAPGEQEDKQGKPFVGASGQLLDKMITAMKLDPQNEVYIANVVKCRPPRNRNPDIEEITACSRYLFKQIELIKPQIIITLGRFAAQTILATEQAVGKLRGKINYFQNTPVIVTYHPSYLLRTPEAKKDAWEDLQLAMRVFSEI